MDTIPDRQVTTSQGLFHMVRISFFNFAQFFKSITLLLVWGQAYSDVGNLDC